MAEKSFKENQVEDIVVEYLKKEGYTCLPDKSRSWKKFSINDGYPEPDIVAFKWNEHRSSPEIIAIECKRTGTYGSIEVALDQIITYQKHFPCCYIATPTSRENVVNYIDHIRKRYHAGYIPVDMSKSSILPFEKIESSYRNERLEGHYYKITRQKLALLAVFTDLFGTSVQIGYNKDNGFVSTNGESQFTINNHNQATIRFGINIEKRYIIKKNLDGKLKLLLQTVGNSKWQDYVITFNRKEYNTGPSPPPMTTIILQKSCEKLTKDDIAEIEFHMNDANFQCQLLLLKPVWGIDEFLSKREHKERILREKVRLLELKEVMGWN